MEKAFELGQIFGIKLKVHYSWFIIFVLVTGSMIAPDYTDWVFWLTGIIASLLLFASVIAHELAHSLVGRANGIPIESITLFIFGGVARMTKEAARPGAEFKMAVAGPVCSLVLGGLFSLLLVVTKIGSPMADMLLGLAVTNGMLAVFNLIPGFPLDGGRIFRSFVWRVTGNYKLASLIAIRLGQSIGFLMIVGGILMVFFHPSVTLLDSLRFDLGWFNGIWIALIGWFLASAASSNYKQINREESMPGFGTLDVMREAHPVNPPDIGAGT